MDEHILVVRRPGESTGEAIRCCRIKCFCVVSRRLLRCLLHSRWLLALTATADGHCSRQDHPSRGSSELRHNVPHINACRVDCLAGSYTWKLRYGYKAVALASMQKREEGEGRGAR